MEIPEGVRALNRDLRAVFGDRLQSLVAYRAAASRTDALVPTMAVVDRVGVDDLQACATFASAWQDAGLATPLVLSTAELSRALDVFPYELDAIWSTHVVVSGCDPFDGLHVESEDLRRACEVEARGHMLHLREGYIETLGRSDLLVDLVHRSAPSLAALLRSVARLNGMDVSTDTVELAERLGTTMGVTSGVLRKVAALTSGQRIAADQARRIFPQYLEAIETVTGFVDRWKK